MNGAGTMTLSGVDSYTGATTASSGILQAGSTSAFGSNSAVTVASGATLDLTGYSNSLGSLAGAGTVTDSSAYGGDLDDGREQRLDGFSGVIQNGAGSARC